MVGPPWLVAVSAPGWCAGVLRRVEQGTGGVLAARRAIKFPSTSRVGLIEGSARVAPGRLSARHRDAFVALYEAPTAADFLVAFRRGACGLVVEKPESVLSRHALSVARALGLPLVTGARLPDDLEGNIVVVDATADTGWIGPPASVHPQPLRPKQGRRAAHWPGRCRCVLPTSMLAGPSDAYLELVTAHLEERLIARDALARGLACGVGLLRLEWVLSASVAMGAVELTEHLSAVLDDFLEVPVAVRLADWGPDKLPCSAGNLYGWSGHRGLAGLLGTKALGLQVRALTTAQRRCGHRSVWLVAPFVEDVASMAHLAGMLEPGGVALGAMVESAAGCDVVGAMSNVVAGVWFGLGDLSAEVGYTAARDLVLSACDHLTVPVHICGELSVGVTRQGPFE